MLLAERGQAIGRRESHLPEHFSHVDCLSGCVPRDAGDHQLRPLEAAAVFIANDMITVNK